MPIVKKLTLVLIGGLIMMMTLTACGSPDSVERAYRTPEQLKLEKEFVPLFDFLAQDQKDFSKVKLYYSHYSIKQIDGAKSTSYDADVKKVGGQLSGVYKIESDGQKTEYPIHLKEEGEIVYTSPVPQQYDEELFNLTLSKAFFRKLPISDYMAKHPETYLKDISYEVDKESEYFKSLMNSYQLSDSADITLYLTSHYIQSDLVFDINLLISDSKKIFRLQNIISFNEEENNDYYSQLK